MAIVTTNLNAHSKADQAVTQASSFWTVTTTVNILLSTGGGTGTSQLAFDKLIEIISLNGQPVILGTPAGSSPYTVSFMIEHAGSWFINDGAKTGNLNAQSFAAALDAHGIDAGFTHTNTTLAAMTTLV